MQGIDGLQDMKHDRTYSQQPCSSHALNSCCNVRKDESLRWIEECPIDMQKEYKLRQTFQAASARNSPCEESFLRWKGLSMQGVEVGLSLQEVVEVGLSLQEVVQVGLSLQEVVQVGLSLQ